MEFEKIQTIIADVLSIHNPEEITMDKSFNLTMKSVNYIFQIRHTSMIITNH